MCIRDSATTVSAQWLTVDEWIGQRLNIRVDVDVSVAIGTDQQQQEISDVYKRQSTHGRSASRAMRCSRNIAESTKSVSPASMPAG